MGLVNRVVTCGSALGQAVNLATLIAKFPQQCLRADRQSAYHAAYHDADFESALDHELELGTKVLTTESVEGELFHTSFINHAYVTSRSRSPITQHLILPPSGAKRFMEGYGRHGSFNLRTPAKS